jgi:hypothetical protein
MTLITDKVDRLFTQWDNLPAFPTLIRVPLGLPAILRSLGQGYFAFIVICPYLIQELMPLGRCFIVGLNFRSQ